MEQPLIAIVDDDESVRDATERLMRSAGFSAETFSRGADFLSSPGLSRTACLEPISKSFEEDNEAGQLEKAEEILGVVLPANEDPALPLNPGEEALDEPASHVAA